jgi:hypothetical protein
MKGLLARSAVAVAIVLFTASAASWRLEPVSAQSPTSTATPVPGSPTVLVQLEDDKIVVGDPARITLIAFDNEAVDWIRWQARFADDADNDNDEADNEDNDEADNDNAADTDVLAATDPDNDNSADDDEDNENDNDSTAIDNDNIDPNADPGLAAVHEFECDEQTACANVWTIITSKAGRYEVVGEVRDTTGLRGVGRAELEVRQRR